MKIGILTQPLHANYGGLLQNYALQQVLIALGHQPETLDWGLDKNLRYRISLLKSKIVSWLTGNNVNPKYQLSNSEKSYIQQHTDYFISKYIQHTRVLRSSRDFETQSRSGNYEAFIVGSDQCWRPSYNLFINEMFLSFTKKDMVKRIAYAASFGTDNWEYSEKQTKACAALIKQFDLVTVREDSGVQLCKSHLGIDAIHVLDPTMLLSKDHYIDLIHKEHDSESPGSLFYYILDPNDVKLSFVEKVSNSFGYKSFSVLPKFQAETRTKEVVKNQIDECVFPSVTAWLRAFMDAKMTIVDSFHGMVFSIIFNKPFWVIGNPKRGMDRFLSLLKLLNLEDRLIDINNDKNIDYQREINWDAVNEVINYNKSISIELLRKSL